MPWHAHCPWPGMTSEDDRKLPLPADTGRISLQQLAAAARVTQYWLARAVPLQQIGDDQRAVVDGDAGAQRLDDRNDVS